MTPAPRSVLQATPWAGVHGTCIDSAQHFGRHWHGTYGLGLLQRGAQRSASGRGVVEAFAGDIITSNPGEVHDGQPLGGESRRWRMLYLDPEVMRSHSGRSGRDQVDMVRPVIQDATLRLALQQLFGRLDAWAASSCPSPLMALGCDEALARLLGLTLARHSTEPTPARTTREARAAVDRARERLADSTGSPPTLDELAAEVGLSKFQLLRRFEQQHGLTPYAWLLWQRAEQARLLIRRGHALAEAAADTGFADQSHMTRTFTRHFGYTPGDWARLAATRFKTG